jgi:molybdate-binding protein
MTRAITGIERAVKTRRMIARARGLGIRNAIDG